MFQGLNMFIKHIFWYLVSVIQMLFKKNTSHRCECHTTVSMCSHILQNYSLNITGLMGKIGLGTGPSEVIALFNQGTSKSSNSPKANSSTVLSALAFAPRTEPIYPLTSWILEMRLSPWRWRPVKSDTLIQAGSIQNKNVIQEFISFVVLFQYRKLSFQVPVYA